MKIGTQYLYCDFVGGIQSTTTKFTHSAKSMQAFFHFKIKLEFMRKIIL
jgi:hypothetical protein